MSYITLSIVFFIASVYTGGLMPMLSSLLVGFSNHFAITAGGRVREHNFRGSRPTIRAL